MKVINTTYRDASHDVAAEISRYSKGTAFKQGSDWIWSSEKHPYKRVHLSPPRTESQKNSGSWSIEWEVKRVFSPVIDQWVRYTSVPMLLDHGLSSLRCALAEASFFLAREGE